MKRRRFIIRVFNGEDFVKIWPSSYRLFVVVL